MMTVEELTPEAAALLRSLVSNPQPLEDSPMLQLLLADRVVMGSPRKVHLTSQGRRLLVAYMATEVEA